MERQDWTIRLKHVMPWGSSTCSKAPQFEPEEPSVIVRGKGCRVWDNKGREFIDFRNALGPVTLGYGFPAVDEAVRKQLESGIIFGHPHPLECEVAEMLRDVVPCAEQVRFLKTGGEAVAACIRAARAATGREHVIQIGYNGWLNSLAAKGHSLPGQPEQDIPSGVPHMLSNLHHVCAWNELTALTALFERYSDQVAALVVAANYPRMGEGRELYPAVRELTRKHGTVLIYDEIVTGFRIAKAGVQEFFNVVPDMAVFAKGIANGMPLSAYVGRRELMECFTRAIVSSTYGGEALSLAAAKATIAAHQSQDVVAALWRKGERMWTAVNQLLSDHHLPARLEGFWPCAAWRFDESATRGQTLQQRFFRAAYQCGVSLYGVSYVNFSLTDHDIDEALDRLDRSCQLVAGDIGL